MLPKDVDDLLHATQACTFKNLRAVLSAVSVQVRALTRALNITDNASAQQEPGAEGWAWDEAAVMRSHDKRVRLLAWHCLAHRADELQARWGLDLVRTQIVANSLLESLGQSLKPRGAIAKPFDLLL